MENLKSLEGKKVRVFEATYNHSSFAAPICIAGKCTFVDVENGWIALDEDKVFNFKFLNRIEIVGEESPKKKKLKAKKEKELLKKMKRKEKREAKKNKKLLKKEKVETIIEKSDEKPIEKEPEAKKEEEKGDKKEEPEEIDDFERDTGEDEEE